MNVLAVFAHPDDEVLGAGGTLAKHAENGDEVRIHLMGRQELIADATRAARVLGIDRTSHGFFEDQRFDTYPFTDLVGQIVGDPDIIYTHHPGDLNTDHALIAKAVLTAFRPKPDEKPRTILACEVLSSTEWTFPQQFQPNWFSELTYDHVLKKMDALSCYPGELFDVPHPRSRLGIMNAATFRGQQCGRRYAEPFQLLRHGPS